MSPLDLLIAALATWRITHMLLYENGPFRTFRYMREALGVEYSEFDEDKIISFRYEITTCIWCLSMWVGAGVALGLSLLPWFVWVLLPYAFSAVSVTINHKYGK